MRRRALWWLTYGVPGALSLLPPLLTIRAVVRDAVDVPWVDQWAFAREVVRAHDGQLLVADLWAQHNEHRVPVTKVVLHLLAWLSGWNLQLEVAANVVVATASLLLVAWIIVRTVGPVAPRVVGVLLLVASALQMSLVQWQNWTWGWQLGLWLAEAAAIGMAAALVRLPVAPARWARVVVLAAVMGALSNGAGLVLLGVAPLALLALRMARVAVPTRLLLGAAVAAGGVGVAYAVGWQPAIGQPAPTPVAGHVVDLLHFALTFLGGPVMSWDPELAWRWGTAGSVVALLCIVLVWVTTPARRAAVVPWAALVAFSFGAAALTSVGRLGAGLHIALMSRYATFAVPLWLALGPLLAMVIVRAPAGLLRAVPSGLAVAGLGLAVWHGGYTWLRGDERMAARAVTARKAMACIAAPASATDACYRSICWDAAYARAGAVMLAARRLGPWRNAPPAGP